MERQKYRTIIQHLVNEGKSAKQIDDKLKTIYGASKPGYSTIKKWVAHFKTGHTSIQDEPRPGNAKNALSPSLESQIEKLIKQNRKLSIRSIAHATGSSYGSVYNFVTRVLGFKKVFARWVPKKLTDAQKAARVTVARSILNDWSSKWAELKTKLITSDETWISCDTPHTRLSGQEWRMSGENPPEIPRIQNNRKKVMMTVFWDSRGPILVDFFVQSAKKGMDSSYYVDMLAKLLKELASKRRGIRKRGPLLLIDNAPIHTSCQISRFLEQKGIEKLEHPPYSPDIAPSDFYLFKCLKTWLRGRKFTDLSELQEAMQCWFSSKSSGWYERAFDEFKERLEQVIEIGGEYINEQKRMKVLTNF